MTPQERTAARERCEAATAGPWIYKSDPEHGCCWDASVTVSTPSVTPDGRTMDWCKPVAEADEDDARFVAAARTDLPAALDEIDRLEESLRKIADFGDGRMAEIARLALMDENERGLDLILRARRDRS